MTTSIQLDNTKEHDEVTLFRTRRAVGLLALRQSFQVLKGAGSIGYLNICLKGEGGLARLLFRLAALLFGDVVACFM